MILKYFKKKQNKNLNFYKHLYIDIVESTKLVSFKVLKINNIDFTVTFEVISILLFCIFFGYRNNTNNHYKLQKQKLMNLFISDIDHSLRLEGLDMMLGKYVKIYIKKFYFRLNELEKIFQSNDINNFKVYLKKYNLINKLITYLIISNFYEELIILIQRCKKQHNPLFLFEDLFN